MNLPHSFSKIFPYVVYGAIPRTLCHHHHHYHHPGTTTELFQFASKALNTSFACTAASKVSKGHGWKREKNEEKASRHQAFSPDKGTVLLTWKMHGETSANTQTLGSLPNGGKKRKRERKGEEKYGKESVWKELLHSVGIHRWHNLARITKADSYCM